MSALNKCPPNLRFRGKSGHRSERRLSAEIYRASGNQTANWWDWVMNCGKLKMSFRQLLPISDVRSQSPLPEMQTPRGTDLYAAIMLIAAIIVICGGISVLLIKAIMSYL
jgi:hypothetical protein